MGSIFISDCYLLHGLTSGVIVYDCSVGRSKTFQCTPEHLAVQQHQLVFISDVGLDDHAALMML